MGALEKIAVYPGTMSLSLSELASKRGTDIATVRDTLMLHSRSVVAPWEDTVTMAVNCAKSMLTEEDRKSIRYLVVGTETGLDGEKSVSSWVHRYLDLPSDCLHFELKSACYSGMASLHCALNWLAAHPNKHHKALVITSDQSLNRVSSEGELVGGGGAVALLVSHDGQFAQFSNHESGIYSHEVSDIIRPLPWVETGDNYVSLISYIEGLTNSFSNLKSKQSADWDWLTFYEYLIFHMPFPGMSKVAHRHLMKLTDHPNPTQINDVFNQKVRPSTHLAGQIGALFGGSIFLGLLDVSRQLPDTTQSSRIGLYAYGSGSCSEFMTVTLTSQSKAIALNAINSIQLDARHPISVDEYEQIEKDADIQRSKADYTPNTAPFESFYSHAYLGQNRLVLSKISGHYREYSWS